MFHQSQLRAAMLLASMVCMPSLATADPPGVEVETGATPTPFLDDEFIELAYAASLLVAQLQEPYNYRLPDDIPGFSNLQVFPAENDGNLSFLAQYNGRCILAHRGPLFLEELEEGNILVLARFLGIAAGVVPEVDLHLPRREQRRCYVSSAYTAALETQLLPALSQALRDCAEECDPSIDNCVILTGSSAGAGALPGSAVYWNDLNPIVFSFGEPGDVFLDCDVINAQRYYRFMNTLSRDGIFFYDFFPNLPSGVFKTPGQLILLSDDITAVNLVGVNVKEKYQPGCHGSCHYMRAKDPTVNGYADRLEKMYRNNALNNVLVNTNGFSLGTGCGKHRDCNNGFCVRGACKIHKLNTCEPCDRNSDCAGIGICTSFLFFSGCNPSFSIQPRCA